MKTKLLKFRILYLILSIFICLVQTRAQVDKPNKKAQLESQKVAFITKKLNLSVTDAQKFWPVYNEYQQKRDEIIKKRREILKRLNKKEEQPSNDELTRLSDEFVQLQVNESKLAADYHVKFKEVLSIRKVLEYYRAEEQFKVFLLNEIKKRHDKPDKPEKLEMEK